MSLVNELLCQQVHQDAARFGQDHFRPKPPASEEDLRFSEWPMDGFETICVW